MAVFKSPTGIDLQNQKGVNFADPSSGTDAATKQYVDNLVNGLAFKEEVRAATITNGTLATAFAAGQTVDGIVLATGDRLLVKNQTTQTENGIWIVPASGAPARAADADSAGDLNRATVVVRLGTVNAGTQWTQGTDNVTVGTSNIVWASSGGGSTYTADGQGIELSGAQFALELDASSGASGLSKGANGLKLDASVAVRKFAADCVVTTNPQTFTHNLGTKDVTVGIRLNATDEIIAAVVVAATINTVTVDVGHPPTAGEYRTVVHG